jgi:pyruvate, water dikinase
LPIWRRLFQRSPSQPSDSKPLGLREQYQRKVRRYMGIVEAGNAALGTLAQLQSDLADDVYITPAYVQLQIDIALGHTRRAVSVLNEFSRGKEQNLVEIFLAREKYLREALSQALSAEIPTLPLPFESQILPQVELLASGMAYPAEGAEVSDQFIIEGIWGLGAAVGEIEARPWKYRVMPGRGPEISFVDSGVQASRLAWNLQDGFKREPLPANLQSRSCLEEEELRSLAGYVGLLSSALPGPQRVVWGLRPDKTIIILRSALIGMPSGTGFPGPENSRELLISRGMKIYPGRASGPALRVDVDRVPDPQNVPAGTVLLADRPALSLAPLLSKAAALVVGAGEARNHLAFLAREARLPTIFYYGGDGALSLVPPGAWVGVDASSLIVFAADPEKPLSKAEPSPSSRQPVAHKILQGLIPYLFPLAAPVLKDKPLTPDDCRSLHEILFCAAAGRLREMFTLSLRAQVTSKDAVSLVTGRMVPILVIDAGGGLSEESPKVNFEAVRSLPFRTFLNGLMSIPWPKARPLDVKGFISVIGVTTTTPRAEDQLRKVSFALISKDYMNFSLCLGYHASTIEAFVGENLDDNYIRFHYQGGAAALERRLRRLQLIGGILSRLGFSVTLKGDLLDGTAIGDPLPALLEKLEILGRLEVYTKQMDMVMSADELTYGYIDDFFKKHVTAGPATPLDADLGPVPGGV